ncbi:ImmA/IrrE family metallo-endopeptidase [Halalkalibacter sp. APA_J-10(15)]|uniref:ImmA/IrrE family metallo-endopeptidase n=1 Tax=Halalkalibacter sp. APA_J-10(15) TaxID=2933805 RepID=UPI001FF3A4D5|nr:ImmA/IrrE family metallo-endopeptidase [Halalkalibacter sp. APA_J-10(15)]MCK0471436.1 ImmA/IrrE family metallo-endopeptidase [Halalkalibacter sp. APA_J-10(15)]
MRFSTLREKKITQVYQQLGISAISDLSIKNVSNVFNFKIDYYDFRSRCIHDDDFAIIALNQNQTVEKIRYDFFHEMAHYFEHIGDQRKINPSFIQLQERQAHSFALVASMPRFIFEPYMDSVASIHELVKAFELPESFIEERIRIIQQQNTTQYQYQRTKQLEEDRVNRSLQPGRVSNETITLLHQLKNQVGEERLSYDVTRLL